MTAKIRKIATMVVLLLSTSGVKVYAQAYNPDYNLFAGGLVGGANFTQVDGDGYKGYDKTGINAGGIIYLPMGDNVGLPFEGTLALSLEVLYEQKGSKGLDPLPIGNVLSQTIDLRYAEVPLQLNFYRGSRKSIFGAGFGVGYLAFSEELVDKGNGVVIKNGVPFHKIDFNFMLTANLHIWNGFFLSPRFEYSLISIRNNNQMYGGRNQQFNNVMALRLMYLVKRRGE
jgi:hypothetical protein